MGRPRKAEAEKLSRTIHVPVTPAVDRALRDRAAALRCDLAYICRMELDEYLKEPAYPAVGGGLRRRG